ncbi:MAG: mannose-6-phosphate isomerase [Anaerolineae bacterium]|nr:mannose-6-phosphate isomerase [Anaerolineae bacterium]
MNNYVTKPIPAEKPNVDLVVRPWGSFRQYAFNQDVTVSLMEVESGKRLSLQSHTGRAELWIVMDPGAVIEVDETTYHPEVGAEIWIPANAKHRLAAQPDLGHSVRVLEVAFGNWQQADITRYADDFNRPEAGE